MKHNMGFHYMNGFKSPVKGFVFISRREDTAPLLPSSRLMGPLLGFGKGLVGLAHGAVACV